MKKICFLFLLSSLLFNSCYKEVISDNEEEEQQNLPPTIQSITADKTELKGGEQILIKCTANDPDGDVLSYSWASFAGEFLSQTTSSSVIWEAPDVLTELQLGVSVKVQDGENPAVSDNISFKVSPKEPEQYNLTLYATDDATVNSGQPDANFGSAQTLYTGKINFGGNGISYYHSYVKFNLSSIPNNAVIVKAQLEIITGNNNSAVKPTGEVWVFGTYSSNWTENNITYNNRPGNGSTPITKKYNVEFDVAAVQRFEVTNHFINSLNSNYYSQGKRI